ncbi:hypothetical protein [Candidatus Venteria ishoeyi]|uniref:Lipoprotein n=1 Tax=Candidatus Venteria ishoeyi TaxID=1899563 RepID=A0A1H6FGL8_9GAMM|nr:hypothetical protein [Candidatus Venteria ishoeyi]SEH08499.1 Uncharacterised protein [Candidatus Venteria ishoeyi]
MSINKMTEKLSYKIVLLLCIGVLLSGCIKEAAKLGGKLFGSPFADLTAVQSYVGIKKIMGISRKKVSSSVLTLATLGRALKKNGTIGKNKLISEIKEAEIIGNKAKDAKQSGDIFKDNKGLDRLAEEVAKNYSSLSPKQKKQFNGVFKNVLAATSYQTLMAQGVTQISVALSNPSDLLREVDAARQLNISKSDLTGMPTMAKNYGSMLGGFYDVAKGVLKVERASDDLKRELQDTVKGEVKILGEEIENMRKED